MNRMVRVAGVTAILSLLVILAAAFGMADIGTVVKTKFGEVSGTAVKDSYKAARHSSPPAKPQQLEK